MLCYVAERSICRASLSVEARHTTDILSDSFQVKACGLDQLSKSAKYKKVELYPNTYATLRPNECNYTVPAAAAVEVHDFLV